MHPDSPSPAALHFFLLILAGALGSVLMGALFAYLIALISPELVSDLFGLHENSPLQRYAVAAGMVCGLFIGIAVSAFACLPATLLKMLRVRLEARLQAREPGGTPSLCAQS